ncbi:MAG: polysaccharide deacetylase family protein [Acidimicrobiales bacterium]
MTCRLCRDLDRRTFVGLLGAGLAAMLGGCGASARPTTGTLGTGRGRPGPRPAGVSRTGPTTTVAPTTTTGPPPLPPIPSPVPGPATVFSQGPPQARAANQVAITIDDGFCQECAAGYAQFAQQSGIHITFNPNGTYNQIWAPLAPTLGPLIEAGQVQIGNHTYSHPDMTNLSDTGVQAELEKNEEWIQSTFGITSRPWWRPPYGYHNYRTDAAAGQVGFTNVLMWNGSYGDSGLLTPQVLLADAQQYLQAGVVMLGHANYPTILGLFGQIQELIAERNLTTVTVDEMFGTSRQSGQAVTT